MRREKCTLLATNLPRLWIRLSASSVISFIWYDVASDNYYPLSLAPGYRLNGAISEPDFFENQFCFVLPIRVHNPPPSIKPSIESYYQNEYEAPRFT